MREESPGTTTAPFSASAPGLGSRKVLGGRSVDWSKLAADRRSKARTPELCYAVFRPDVEGLGSRNL